MCQPCWDQITDMEETRAALSEAGESRAGHSFILVGPDGTIQWRADYGRAPDYTMYLPTEKVLSDLARERAAR